MAARHRPSSTLSRADHSPSYIPSSLVQGSWRNTSMADENQPLLQHSNPDGADGSESPSVSTRQAVRLSYLSLFRGVLLILVTITLIAIGGLTFDIFTSIGASSPVSSGFESLAVSLLILASLLSTLLFYEVPSYTHRVLGAFSLLFWTVDIALVLLVPELKHRLGEQGLWCFSAAFGVFTLGTFADQIVDWAKHQDRAAIVAASATTSLNEDLEEENSNRHTLSEWANLLVGNLLRLVLLGLVFVLSFNLIIDAADSGFPALGDTVAVPYGNVELDIHIACIPAGASGPVVLVEGGEGSAEDAASWALQTEHVSTVCYWDRPGFGFSDNGPSPLSIGATVDILVPALQQVIPDFLDKQVVLVSHGVGSLYSLVLATKLAAQVQGIMLVDGLHEELFYQREHFIKGLLHFWNGLLSPVNFQKVQSLVTGHGSAARLYGIYENLQARLHKALLQQQLSANRQSRRDLSEAMLGLPNNVPLLVVSSSEMTLNQEWSTYQRLLLKLSSNVLAWKLLDGPHEIWKNRQSARELSRLLSQFVQYAAYGDNADSFSNGSN